MKKHHLRLLSLCILALLLSFAYSRCHPASTDTVSIVGTNSTLHSHREANQALEPSTPVQNKITANVQLPQSRRKLASGSTMHALISANASKMGLNYREMEELSADLAALESLKRVVESGLIRQKAWDGTTLTLEIPNYAEKGEYLRASLYQNLQSHFTEEQIDRIDALLGQFIDSYYANFGASTQTFTVTYYCVDNEYRVKDLMEAVNDGMQSPIFKHGIGDKYSLTATIRFSPSELQSNEQYSLFKPFLTRTLNK